MNVNDIKQALSGKRVAIVGDCMLDRYISGRVHRMSPEAPVPVLLYDRTVDRLGGAANVALNVHHLESTPILCSIIGDDEAGNELCQLLKDLEATTDYMVRSNERRTTVKTRLLGNNQHLLRLDAESSGALSASEESRVISILEEMFKNERLDVLILQDYNKGLLSPKVIEFVVNKCRAKDVFIAVDPKFDNFFAFKQVDLFKPNLKEIGQALGRQVMATKEDLDQAAAQLSDRLQAGSYMITLSEAGVYLACGGQPSVVIPTERAEIVDVCGAGDAVLAVSSLMLYSGLGVSTIGLVANKAGKIVCGKIGVAPVSLEELIKDA